jgi:vitamin B12 transporter
MRAFGAQALCCLFVLSIQNAGAALVEDEIVVSATRTPRPVEEIGSSVAVIDAAAMEFRQYQFASEALRDAPGVALAQNGGPGGFSGARIRGIPGAGVLVVIDGVVSNDPSAPSGGFDFASLDASGIERIEILRGPQSILYGADALGGVVSITTKRQNGADAYVESGSRDTARAGLGAGFETSSAYGRITASGARSTGLSRAAAGSERDGYSTEAVSVRGGSEIAGNWRALLAGRFSHSVADIDGFPPPAFNFADTDESERTNAGAGSLVLVNENRSWTQNLTVGYSTIHRRNFDGDSELFFADGERLSVEYAVRTQLVGWADIFAGARYERTSAEVSGINDDAAAGGAFVLLEAKPSARLSLSAGVRRDEFAAFKGATTARVAAALKTGDKGVLRVSWGQGFQAPTLFQLHFNLFGFPVDPDLRPERSGAVDFGYEQKLGGAATLRATFFRQVVRDLIDFDFASGGYVNIGEIRSRGLEAEAAWRPSSFFAASLNYTLTDAIDRASGLQLPRQPVHKGVATFSFSPTDRVSLGASLIVNGKERDFPTGNAAFVLADITASWRVTQALEIYGRIENAAGADYEDVSGYAEPPRSAYGGMRVKL